MPIQTKVLLSSFCLATLFLMVTAILAYQMQNKYPNDTKDTFDSPTARQFIQVMLAAGVLCMLSSVGGFAASVKLGF
jgi:CHASE3 domain sensor protein